MCVRGVESLILLEDLDLLRFSELSTAKSPVSSVSESAVNDCDRVFNGWCVSSMMLDCRDISGRVQESFMNASPLSWSI